MDIAIDCLDFGLVKKKDLERDIDSLIHYKKSSNRMLVISLLIIFDFILI